MNRRHYNREGLEKMYGVPVSDCAECGGLRFQPNPVAPCKRQCYQPDPTGWISEVDLLRHAPRYVKECAGCGRIEFSRDRNYYMCPYCRAAETASETGRCDVCNALVHVSELHPHQVRRKRPVLKRRGNADTYPYEVENIQLCEGCFDQIKK